VVSSHFLLPFFQGGQLTPIDLVVEERFHRAAPGGMGGTKAAGNYSPVRGWDVCACVFVCLCVCVWVWVCVCACVFVFVYTYLHVYVRVHVCVCVHVQM